MHTQAFNDYIGIPFEIGGRVDKLDCYGLVRSFYLYEMGITLPEYDLYSDFNPNLLNKLIDDGLLFEGFLKVDSPKIGDLGLYKFHGKPTHLTIYIGNNKILHTMRGVGSIIEKTDSPRLKGRFIGWYRKENKS